MDLLLRKTTMICLLLVFSLLLSAVSADRIDALLGESVMFTATRKCSRENAKLTHQSRDDRPVASYQSGEWSPGPDYKDRVCNVNDTVTLNNTNINDNGLYELTGSKCDETPRTQLHVVPFHVVQVVVGQPVTLQCHYVTTNKKVKCAWWEKDGKRVFGTNFPPGEIKPEARFEGNVSLADEALKRGNFSVTVRQVQQEHGGVYICYVQVGGEKKRGIPAATRLTVNEEKLGSYRRCWNRTGEAGIVHVAKRTKRLQPLQKRLREQRRPRAKRKARLSQVELNKP
ncbi:uncharacterized protein LOC111667105 isoform X2 [Seriola lalandi dorsalis]|uniref:uncharacterized protein LOC111667105 isoform X2 n=1 Tax=Seriola lalandi dorsalis TaxID=1841481 RepID=UPI000C6FC113|nr:uncharacterized protein LOC111667105 isoform X2 [Seriola lalandi dorsalis]